MSVVAPPSSRRGAVVALAGAIAVGSFAFTLIKVVLREVSPLTLAAGRVVFSALAFVLVVTLQPHRRRSVAAADRWRVLFCGFGGSAGFHVLFSWGQSRTSVAASAVVLATMPVVVAVGEAAFLRQRVRPGQVAGLALSLAGVAVIARAGGGAGGSSLPGLVAVGAATVVWAAVTVTTRSLAHRYDPWWLNTPGTVAGALVMLAVAAPRAHELGRLRVSGWVEVAWLGAVSSAFIYAALARALRHFSATATASASTLVTPLSVLVAWAGLGERPAPAAVAGVVAVVGGVLLTTRTTLSR